MKIDEMRFFPQGKPSIKDLFAISFISSLGDGFTPVSSYRIVFTFDVYFLL